MAAQASNTSAHQLHQILERVRNVGSGNFRDAWGSVLGAEYGSAEFAARHAEVCLLLADVTRQIKGLPDRSRDRLIRYVNTWWTAVVQPDFSWGDSSRSPSNAIDLGYLDHLESAADIISASFGGSSISPAGGGLSQLRDQCEDWLGIIDGLDGSELPESLRDALSSQIRHLLWLIDNVDLFGVSRVSQEAVSVVGAVAQASSVIKPRDEQSMGRWKKGVTSLLAAMALVTSGATAAHEAIGAGDGLVREIVQIVSGDGPTEQPKK